MEEPVPVLPAPENDGVQHAADQSGPQAVEALAWAIAQEFVLAMDDFHDALLRDDDPADSSIAKSAGQ